MQFEQLAAGFGALEAPRVDAADNLYFSDIIFNTLYKRTPAGALQRLLEGRVNLGGLVFNRDGRLICSGQGGLLLLDEHSGVGQPLLTHIEGRAIDVVNDIHTDAAGSLYGGTLDYAGLLAGQAPAPGLLFRLDPPDRVTVLCRDIQISNGIGFSPNRRHLYHADTASGVWIYDLDGADGMPARRLFAALPGSDGLAVDAEGGVWVACFNSAEVVCFRPDGTVAQRIGFEAHGVLSLCFGGADLRDLYVVTTDDFTDPSARRAAVYRGRSAVAGQPLPLAQF